MAGIVFFKQYTKVDNIVSSDMPFDIGKASIGLTFYGVVCTQKKRRGRQILLCTQSPDETQAIIDLNIIGRFQIVTLGFDIEIQV